MSQNSEKDEEALINLIKDTCKLKNVKPEDWKTYGPEVNKSNIFY